MRLRFTAVCIALIGVFVGALPAAASGSYQAPRKYYLALGDSLAYGYEQAKATPGFSADNFDTGYVNDFWNAIRTVRPDVQLVNYGCPGETSGSYFVACAFHSLAGLPLHNTYDTSQEQAALTFLAAHPGQVSPITIDLGANDALNLTVHQCDFDPSCVAANLGGVLTALAGNLARTLSEIRAVAPRSEIIVMEYYNPLYVVSPATDGLVGQFNGVIANAATAYGARLANAFPVINGNPAFPSEAAAVCSLTGMCFPPPGGDVHANDAGYALIAQQFWAASGYGALD